MHQVDWHDIQHPPRRIPRQVTGEPFGVFDFTPVGLSLAVAGTLLLANIINHTAAAVIMAPIAIGIAEGLGGRVDPFLMAVAVGASLPFLTPVGHQANILVMGPGCYAFGDYWRLGLPLSLLVVGLAPFLIKIFWPF